MPVEELLNDVYFHFNHSAKRKEEYREFLEFCDVAPLKILKHVSTWWLSLEKCANRFLQQWPVLLSYVESHFKKKWMVESGNERLCEWCMYSWVDERLVE